LSTCEKNTLDDVQLSALLLQFRQKQVEEISPTMCLAKWLQSTVLLQNGFTHSCHHPTPHKIPLEEIKEDPSALHNTKFKQTVRSEMRNGCKPEDCNYCWNIEGLGKDYISDRVYKSTDTKWAYPFLDKVKNLKE
jgi:hypothetical protein